MKFAKVLIFFCFAACIDGTFAFADNPRILKGFVITSKGAMVPEFTVTVKPVTNKPELVRRKRFKNGEFVLPDLDRERYQVLVTAPALVGVKWDIAFDVHSRTHTYYRIAVLHQLHEEGDPLTDGALNESSGGPADKIPAEARAAYKQGVDLHRDGHIDEAMLQYARALRIYPRYVQALEGLGTIYLLFNRPESALAYLRRAQEIDGSSNNVRLNIAIALMIHGDYSEANKNFQDVLSGDPQNSTTLYYIARIQYLQKRFVQAEQTLWKAIQQSPNMLDAWLLLIDVALEQKNNAMARDALVQLRGAMHNAVFTKFVDEQLSVLGTD